MGCGVLWLRSGILIEGVQNGVNESYSYYVAYKKNLQFKSIHMKTSLTALFILWSFIAAFGQQVATTTDQRKVFLYEDGTWKFADSVSVVQEVLESGSSTSEKLSSSVQCNGLTQKGARCRNKTLNKGGYCYLHVSQQSNSETNVKPPASPQKELLLYSAPVQQRREIGAGVWHLAPVGDAISIDIVNSDYKTIKSFYQK